MGRKILPAIIFLFLIPCFCFAKEEEDCEMSEEERTAVEQAINDLASAFGEEDPCVQQMREALEEAACLPQVQGAVPDDTSQTIGFLRRILD